MEPYDNRRGSSRGRPEPYDPRRHDQRPRYTDSSRWTGREERGRALPPPHQDRRRGGGYHDRSRSREARSSSTSRRGGGGNTSWTLAERRHVQQAGLWVHTNALRVRVPHGRCVWYVYRVDIFPVIRRQDEQGKYVSHKIQDRDAEPDPDGAPSYKMIDNTDRTALTQQICRELTRRVPHLIADGSEIALSMHPVLGESEDKRTFDDIHLPRDTTIDDPEAPYVGTSWWIVELIRLPQSVATEFDAALNKVLDGRLQKIEHYMTLALRSSSLGMPSFGRNPLAAYLPMPLQFRSDLLGGALARRTGGNRGPGVAQASVALHSTACVTQDKSLIIKANAFLSHVLPDRTQPDVDPRHLKGRIPLLDPQTSTLAGVKVRLDQIVPAALRSVITEQLAKLSLEILYQKSLDRGEWVKKMREEGKTVEWLDKNMWMIRKKKRLFKHNPADMIEWDPSTFTFDWNGQPTTVVEYFYKYYGIELKYPKMPLIRTGRVERFPSEFLFQGLSASGADSVNKTEDCLKFFDTFSGPKRLAHIDHVLKVSGLLKHHHTGELQQAFARLGLGVETTQEKVKADVLESPELYFQGHHSSEIADGSWKMQNCQFLRCSQLYSFSVIRLTGPSTIGSHEIEAFFNGLQGVFQQTGVKVSFRMSEHLQNNIVDLDPASTYISNSLQWDDAVEAAQQCCWQSFHGLGTGIAPVRHSWSGAGQSATIRECVLRPNPDLQTVDQFLALPIDREKFVASSGNVWAQFSPDLGGLAADRIRDIRWNVQTSQFELESKSVKVKALRFGQQDDENPCGILRGDFYPCVERGQISHPTLVFILCSEKLLTSHYNEIKWACERRGLQSQVVRMDKFMDFDRRSRAAMYLSNLTLKLNGKASSSINRATAWSVPELESRTSGMLILGYTMSSGSGTSGKMVVCGSCLLDSSGMRFAHSAMVQDKDTVVAGTVMKNMVKNLYQHWFNHSGRQPSRILIFRNGGNDGQFKEIAETEVNAIRVQIAEFCLQDQPVPENRSPSTPPITFVVTQSNHNLVIAPDESHHRQCNVPGGTSLRKSNILPRTHHLDGDENNINGMDFFLTAHQGLKGTSKPILYRCLVNEDSNTVPLDRDALRRVTYLLSFQYATAPKAIRDVSLLRYSNRQAKRMHSVLEKLVDSSLMDITVGETEVSSSSSRVVVQREIDAASGKSVYGRRRKESGDSTLIFDFLDASGSLSHNGQPQPQIPFYPNLAM